MTERAEKVVWFAVSGAAAIMGHHVARRSLDSSWKQVTGSTAPNRGSLKGELRPALVWGALSGTIVAMARVLARRGAEEGWRRALGSAPPFR
jgi:hypothetical protein